MQKTKLTRYVLFYIFTLFVYSFAKTHIEISLTYRYIFISIPIFFGIMLFAYLNKEKYKLSWLRALISVTLSTVIFVSAYLMLALVWNKVYLTYISSVEVIVWIMRISFDVLLVLLVSILFYFALMFSGRKSIIKLKISKQFIALMLGVIIFTIIVTFGIEACTPRILTSKIVGDFGSMIGYRYANTFKFLLDAINVSAVWVIAMWADFCNSSSLQTATKSKI